MSVVSTVIGAVLVLGALWDLSVTVLHPSRRGFLSYRSGRAAWKLVRGIARAVHSESLMTYAAPGAMLANFLTWVTGLWVGFALIYLPWVHTGLSYDPSGHFGHRGLAEALYLSGEAISTVGFGDVSGNTDLLRLLLTFEAGSGLAAVTGAIAYVLSVYPLISEVRGAGQRLADGGVGDAAGAARLVVRAGTGELRHLQHALLSVHQQIRRFPVLYYFHAQRDEESLYHLLRASTLVTLQAQWGLRTDEELAGAGFYGGALARSLTRVMEDLERDFLPAARDPDPLDDEEAERRLERLRRAAEEGVPGSAAAGGAEGFSSFLSHAEGFLGLLAQSQGYDHEQLLTRPRGRRAEAPV